MFETFVRDFRRRRFLYISGLIMIVVLVSLYTSSGGKMENERSTVMEMMRNVLRTHKIFGAPTILDPYSLEDDRNIIKCIPLKTAKNKEPICVYNSSADGYISTVLNSDGVWEGDMVQFCRDLLLKYPDTGLIDIGTNIGVYTLTAASYGIDVVGVEPYPPNLQRLAKSLRSSEELSKRVKILPYALSDRYETMNFFIRDSHPGATQLHSNSRAVGNSDTHKKVLTMEVSTILMDDLLQFISFTKAILKMDIEGGEYRALKAASELFKRIDIPYVFMEWDNKCNFAEWRKFFIGFFKERQYTVHRASPKMEPLELSEEGCQQWPFDVIFQKQYT